MQNQYKLGFGKCIVRMNEETIQTFTNKIIISNIN